MPFGLTNAPVVFQRFVNTVFADLLDVCVIVYLDDILIYSTDKAFHKEHVQEVLQRLHKHGLYAKPEKCKFHIDSTEYLGYQLSPSGLIMSPDKVQTIQDWPEPRKVKDIQSFLGFTNFYQQFIDNYSNIVTPLTCLTCKGTTWNFSDSCHSAFHKLKDAFTSALMIVETDTSDYAIASILSLRCSNDKIRPVAYYPQTLSTPELKYDTHDKELLAIHEVFKLWCHYLEGSAAPIDVVTDHKSLEYFATTKLLTRWQACWLEFLSQFNMVVCFRPGKLGVKPDSLTGRWEVYPKQGDKDYTHVNPHNFRQSSCRNSSLHPSELLISQLRSSGLVSCLT